MRLRSWTLITGISSKDGATPLTASTRIGLSWQKFRRYFLETDVLNKTLYIDIFTSSCLQINIDMLTLMNGQSLSQSDFVGRIFGFLYWFSIILLWLFYSHFDSLRSFLTYLLTNSSSQSKNNFYFCTLHFSGTYDILQATPWADINFNGQDTLPLQLPRARGLRFPHIKLTTQCKSFFLYSLFTAHLGDLTSDTPSTLPKRYFMKHFDLISLTDLYLLYRLAQQYTWPGASSRWPSSTLVPWGSSGRMMRERCRTVARRPVFAVLIPQLHHLPPELLISHLHPEVWTLSHKVLKWYHKSKT